MYVSLWDLSLTTVTAHYFWVCRRIVYYIGGVQTFRRRLLPPLSGKLHWKQSRKFYYHIGTLSTNLHSDKCQNTVGMICSLVSDLPTKSIKFVISSFRREVNENCALMGCVQKESQWPASFLDSCPLKMGLIRCPEMSISYYHYSLRDNPQKRSSQV